MTRKKLKKRMMVIYFEWKQFEEVFYNEILYYMNYFLKQTLILRKEMKKRKERVMPHVTIIRITYY
jgi:hypothetical protein